MQQRIEHTISMPAEHFWDVFFREEYVRREHLEALACQEFSVISPCSGAPRFERTLFALPHLNIPNRLQKIVGSRVGYTETGYFDSAKQRYCFRLVPSILPTKIFLSGWYEVEALDAHSCKRICSLDSRVSVFGLGKMMEETIAKSNEDIQRKTAAFMSQWWKERGTE